LSLKCYNFDVELQANLQELEYQTSIILQLYICSLDYIVLFVVPSNMNLMFA